MLNTKVIDLLFIIILLSPPFKFANKIFTLPGFITGPFTTDLVAWPLLIGMVYTMYCQFKYGNVIAHWDKFKRFILAYFVVLVVSLVWGYISYPYFDLAFQTQTLGSGKIVWLMNHLSAAGVPINEGRLMGFWMFARPLKTILLNLFYTFGGAYMIYCWYHNRVEQAVRLVMNVTVGFLFVLAAYGIVEVCYQNGQMWAQKFLLFMWPILHSNPNPGHHFYPELMGARVRTLFLEASYFGIYLSFAVPILWWKMTTERGIRFWILSILYVVLAFELYLMQSRTASAIFIGELLLLTAGALYIRKRRLLLNTLGLFLGALIAFGGSMYFLEHYQVPVGVGSYTPVATKRLDLEKKGLWGSNVNKNNLERSQVMANNNSNTSAPDKRLNSGKKGPEKNNEKKSSQATSYINDSLFSLVDTEKAKNRAGSNHVRYGITLANIEIGLHHNPLLGVGSGLDTAYLYDKFKADKNGEIQRFIKQVKTEGLLNSGSPFMCEYTAQFMQTGILGLAFFVMPMMYVLFQLLMIFLKSKLDYCQSVALLFIILVDVGLSITGFGNTLNITYCYWLMLGLSYAVYYSFKSKIAK